MISATISPKFSLNSLSRFTLLFLLLAFVGAALSVATAQTENILHRFNPTTTDGYNSGNGLVGDKAGNLYGVTVQGGTLGLGTVFELSPPSPGGGAWVETILHEFAGNTDGAGPLAALAIDKNGNLFGTTLYGGVGVNGNSNGTAFELSPPTVLGGSWTYTVIASFDSGVVAISPSGQLTIDAAGNLYGYSGGGNNNFINCGGNCGNIFELQPPAVLGGAWTASSIYDFNGGTTDGFGPSGIIVGPGGVLYGTTGEGGPQDFGTFFKLTPPTSGGTWTEKILYEFTSANGAPFGGLLPGPKGSYFGTSEGPASVGTVFELSPPSGGTGWTASTLYNFTGGLDGSSPFGVISDRSGNLYGVNINGGIQNPGNCLGGGCGTVYKLSPPTVLGGAWTETTLHDFGGNSDGGNPKGPLVLRKGLLFGVTSYGGTKYSGGTVFRVTP